MDANVVRVSRKRGTRDTKPKKRRSARRARPELQAEAAESDLLRDVRRALDDPHPLSLLMFGSMILYITDKRGADPFARGAGGAPKAPPREELVGTFIEVPNAETSALLSVVAAMADGEDALLRARIRRELGMRPETRPSWLVSLSDASTYRALRMSHVLGDGDDIILGVRLPDGDELTCVVYIDHNLGTLVKDAFVVPVPIDEILAELRKATDDPDVGYDDISLADARAWVEAAIELAAITYPPVETETWPACRALVEWSVRDLPDGGTGYQRPEWDSDALTDLAEGFFGSNYGSGLDTGDHREMLDSLLWYATDYGPGDPLLWSPVRVEILLYDWIPRKIIAPADYLAKAPELLRAFIRFAHLRSGVRDGLTDETLSAIDDWEPRYQEAIRGSGPQGPDALLNSLGIDFSQVLLESLAEEVGGQSCLDGLDDEPLPDETFRWEGVPADVAERVAEVLALVDRCCAEVLDVEHRTACRRLLARIASRGPGVFRRKARAETAAAAVVWIIGKANDLFHHRYGRMQVKELMGHFGIAQGGVSQRAVTLLRAGGFNDDTYNLALGDAGYLVAARRRRMITLRDDHRARADSML